jgi:hypothetical protein
MGSVEVFDNFLENDLIIFLNSYFLNTPHYYGHTSNKQGNFFYATNLDVNDPLISFLCKKIVNKKKNNIEILRVYINVQHLEMNGEFHEDDGDTTYLVMISKTLNEKSGEFQIIDKNNELKTFNFVQNRLIMFSSNLKHRGMAPLEKNTPRITLVFKTKNIYE